MTFVAKGINVSCRTILDRAYIILEDKDEIYCLNEPGSFIWDEIDGTKSLEQIVDAVVKEYEGNVTEINQTILEFISELSKYGMVVFSEEPFEGVMQSV